jgi:hypothetical protein
VRKEIGYWGDQRRYDGESKDTQASCHFGHFNGQKPQEHAQSAARKGRSRINLERQDYLSVDLPIAALRPRLTSENSTDVPGMDLDLIGGERGTRTLDPGIMNTVIGR